jgi:hypothetical protein
VQPQGDHKCAFIYAYGRNSRSWLGLGHWSPLDMNSHVGLGTVYFPAQATFLSKLQSSVSSFVKWMKQGEFLVSS